MVLSNLSLRRKIMGIVLLVMLSLTITATVGFSIIAGKSYDLLYQSMAENLSTSAKEVSAVLSESENLSYLMLADPALQRNLALVKATPAATPLESSVYQSLYASLQTYHQQFRRRGCISYISLYNDRFTTHTYATEANRVPSAITDDLLARSRAGKGSAVWVTDYTQEYGLFLVRDVLRSSNLSLDRLGTLVLRLDLNQIMKNACDFRLYNSSQCLLYDAATPMYLPPELAQANLSDKIFSGTQAYDILKSGKQTYFAVHGAVPSTGWSFATLIDFAPIAQSNRRTQWMFLGAILFSVLLCLLLTSRLAASLSRHFDNLIRKMRVFGEYDTRLVDVGYDYTHRTDEIGVLHRQFDEMVTQIQELIECNYVNELLCRDAQLKALEMQINPHFLYNTLESVNWRAKAIGATEISQMTEALGRLLRIILDKQSARFTLARELELVDSYMTIQQLRFEERLQYRVQLDRSLLCTRLPRLTIQPLVENAIRYTIEECPDSCTIEIAAVRRGDDVCITVSDSGSEFPEDFLEKLERLEVPSHGLGIGLKNIHDRLRLTFGKKYGLSFRNEGDCAVVQITVPFQPIDDAGEQPTCSD